MSDRERALEAMFFLQCFTQMFFSIESYIELFHPTKDDQPFALVMYWSSCHIRGTIAPDDASYTTC